MANFSFLKRGINSAVRRNLDGSYLAQELLTSPYSAQFPGSSPYTRLGFYDAVAKIQTGRTVYTTSSADQGSPFVSGVWSISWEDEFPDTNYSVFVSTEDQNFSQSSPAMSPPGILVISKTKT